MKLDEIEELDKATLLHLLELCGLLEDAKEAGLVGDAAGDVEDDLRAILISFAMSQEHFEEICEMSILFDLSFELVSSMLESNNWWLSWEMVEDLQSLSALPPCPLLRVDLDVIGKTEEDIAKLIPARMVLGSVLVFILPRADLLSSVTCGRNNRAVVQVLNTVEVGFGYHPLDLQVTSRVSPDIHYYVKKRVLLTNAVYEYNLALDSFLDLLVWGWEGSFTADLENALLQLLVFTHEDVHAMIQQWKTMFRALMPSAGDDLEQLMKVIVEDLHQALGQQSAYAVGRLQQSFNEFLELKEGVIGMMVTLPSAFFDAIRIFIEAKVAASPQGDLVKKLRQLIQTGEAYRREAVAATSSGMVDDILRVQSFVLRFANSPLSLQQQSVSTITTNSSGDGTTEYKLTQEDVLAVLKLKPKPTDAMVMMSSLNNTDRLAYVPVIGRDCIANKATFDQQIDVYSARLFGDVVNINSMMGFLIDQHPVQTSIDLIMSSLDHGMTYVTSETGKLMFLFPMVRSCIPLRHPETQQLCSPPLSLTKRLRDIARIFRTKKQKTLSLRLNTSFDLTLAMLRQYHGADCWIGPALEQVWRQMLTTQPMPQLLVFELWYGDDLIAADFAHPSHGGLTVYVATRCFDRNNAEFRHLKPGFLLALVECWYLQRQGCYLWDLGGVNMCPLMRYKYDLAGVGEERPLALAHFRDIVQQNETGQCALEAGVLIEDITLQHLFGY